MEIVRVNENVSLLSIIIYTLMNQIHTSKYILTWYEFVWKETWQNGRIAFSDKIRKWRISFSFLIQSVYVAHWNWPNGMVKIFNLRILSIECWLRKNVHKTVWRKNEGKKERSNWLQQMLHTHSNHLNCFDLIFCFQFKLKKEEQKNELFLFVIQHTKTFTICVWEIENINK